MMEWFVSEMQKRFHWCKVSSPSQSVQSVQPFQMASPGVAHRLWPSISSGVQRPVARSAYAFNAVQRHKQESNQINRAKESKEFKEFSIFDLFTSPSAFSGLIAFSCAKVRCKRSTARAVRAVSKETETSEPSETSTGQWRLWMACVAALPGSFQYGFGLSGSASNMFLICSFY